MGLTRLAVQRPLAVLMGLLTLVLMGGVAYTYLKVDRLPPISTPFISISVNYPQASAQDVEALITEPVENALAGMEGVASITSTSSEGVSRVNVQLADGANADSAAVEAGRRLSAIRNRLPNEAGDPNINKADINAFPIMNIALTGAPLDQLYDLASTQLQPELQSVLGVASVSISGGLVREVQVLVDPIKLGAYNLSVQQLTSALTAANVTAPVGSLQQGSKVLNLRAIGRFESPTDLESLVVAQTAAGPVLLRDVATVQAGYKDQNQLQRLNGQDAVGLVVVKQSDANAIQVADDVRAEMARLSKLLPAGTSVQIINDSSVFTRASLDAIQRDLILAVLLVAAVILLFLHEWRNTLIVILAIPTSLISTFLIMFLFGFTLNIMSLMALALMIGILVDDSIVVLENIYRHLQMGENPIQAALKGRSEIGLAAIAITAADVVVYVPIAFMTGMVGQLFREYALTVVAATLLSLLTSFTLAPMLASRWLHHDADGHGPLARFGRWWDARFGRLGAFVSWTIPRTIRVRWLVILFSVVLVGGAVAMLPLHLLSTEYAPQEDDSNIQVNLQTPPGSSLDATDRAARQLEAALQQVPEVRYVFTSVSGGGGGFGGFGGSGGRAGMAVQLAPKGERTRSAFEVIDQIRLLGRQIPGANVNASVNSPLGGGGGGSNAAVTIQIRGPDLEVLNQVSQQVQAVAATIPGMADLRDNGSTGMPELQIRLDRGRMAQLGVTTQQVTSALRATLGGNVASQLRPTGKVQQDITVVATKDDRANLTNFASIPVGSGPGGAMVTLGQVATIVQGTGPVQIQRVDRNRSLTLSGQASGRSLGDVSADLTAAIRQMSLPAGYSVNLGGQSLRLNSALASLGQALALSLILEYMLLVALYESLLYPLVRLLAVPLGMVGSFLALYLTGNTINIFSIIGLIMAEGLVAKSSILLIDYTNTLRERGLGRTEALAQAARTRLRPILMTSATMIFGMLPLALKLEPGAESRAPMAVVIIGGMLSSTLLTLVVIPALYTVFDDLQVRLSRRRQRGRPAAPAEPLAASAALSPAHAGVGDGSVAASVRQPAAPAAGFWRRLRGTGA